jgi:hypothetical protein
VAEANLRRAGAPEQFADDPSAELAIQAHIELSRLQSDPIRQMEHAEKAVALSSRYYDHGNTAAKNKVGLLFTQATGGKWVHDWATADFKCKPKNFNPAAFLDYIRTLSEPAAFGELETNRHSSRFRADSVRSKLEQLYWNVKDPVNGAKAYEQVHAVLKEHARLKAGEAEANLHTAGAESSDHKLAAARAAVDAYRDLYRANEGDDGAQHAAIVRCMEIQQMYIGFEPVRELLPQVNPGPGQPEARDKYLAFRTHRDAADSFWKMASVRPAPGQPPVFQLAPFMKFLEINRKLGPHAHPRTVELHLLPMYEPKYRAGIAEQIRETLMPQALPTAKNDVGLNFDDLVSGVIDGYIEK